MANVGTATFRAVADFSSIVKESKTAAGALGGLGAAGEEAGTKAGAGADKVPDKWSTAATKMGGIGKKMSLGITAPVSLIGGVAIASFADFERSLTMAGQKAGATGDQMTAMKNLALDMGAKTAFSAGEAAAAMDNMAAGGLNAAQTMDALPAVLLAAQASGEDLALTGQVIVQSMNAFGLSAKDAAHVSDVFAQAANTTALDMGGLADGMAQAGEVGSRFGQQIEGVTAWLGRLVDQGVPAASAGAAIRQAFTSLASPTKTAANVFKELGIQTRDANGKMLQAPALLQNLGKGLDTSNPKLVAAAKAAGMSAQAYKDWALKQSFGVEGAKAVSLALSDGKPFMLDTIKDTDQMTRLTAGLAKVMGVDAANAFIKAHTENGKFVASGADAVVALDAMGKASDGMSKKMSDALGETTAQKIDNMKGSFETLGIAMIGAVADPLKSIIDKVATLVGWFATLTQANPIIGQLAVAFLLVLAAVGPLLIGISKIITAVQIIMPVVAAVKEWAIVTKVMAAAQWLLNAAMSANPIGLIIVAIIALVAAIIWLWNNNEGFRNFVIAAWEAIKNAFSAVIGWIVNTAWPWLKGVFDAIVSALQTVWQFFVTAWNAIASVVSTVWNAIVGAISAALSFIWAAIQAYVNFYLTLWRTVWNAIVAVAQFVWNLISTIVTTYLNIVRTIITTVLNAVLAVWRVIWNAIVTVAQAVWRLISAVVSLYIAIVRTVITAVLTAIKAVWTTIWNGIVAVVRTVWGVISNVVSTVINAVWSKIVAVLGLIKTAWSTAWNTMKTVLSTIWNTIKTIVGGAIDWILQKISAIAGAISGALDKVSGAVSWIKDHLPSIPGMSTGGLVPGTGRGDHVPRMLEPGEFVLTRAAVARVGVPALTALNKGVGGAAALVDPLKAAGLQVAPSLGAIPSPVATQQTTSTRTGGDVQVVIQNPVPERASESLYRAAQRLAWTA